jgi:hypothetical protein
MYIELNGKFHGGERVGIPRLRWEDIRSDSLLLNLRGWMRLAEDRYVCGELLLKRPGPDAGSRSIEEKDEVVPGKSTRNVLLALSNGHLELQIPAVSIASCATISSQGFGWRL